jgi:alpha-tubulin suppressor-like RCC1 family protein
MVARLVALASLCITVIACSDDDSEARPDAAVDALGDAPDAHDTLDAQDTLDTQDTLDAQADAQACQRPGSRRVRALSAGEGYSLALLDNGDVMAWGGVLAYVGGNGKPRQKLVPPYTIDTGCANAVEVSAGRYHGCARFDSGDIRCWGRNDTGQLGVTGIERQVEPTPPVALGPGRSAVALFAGWQLTCALLDDSQLRCFGADVGDGQSRSQLIPFGPGRTAKTLGPGESHLCAILDDGQLRCWGTNEDGQLGLGDTAPRLRPEAAVAFGPGRTAVEVDAGYHFTCARLDDGTVTCWGRNLDGQVGVGDIVTHLGPTTPVPLGAAALEVALGFDFACARLADGLVKCWGGNGSGQLGVGDGSPHALPTKAVDFGGGRKAVELAVGINHACARLEDGIVKCWGDNDLRQLGTPDPLNHGDSPDELGDNLPAVPLGN